MRLNELLNQHQIAKPGSGRAGGDRPASPHGAKEGSLPDLETVLSVIRKINTSLVLSDILGLVIDHAIRTTRADRGFIMLADTERRLHYVVGRDKKGTVIPPGKFQVSDSVLQDVFATGESVCAEDALNDERFERRQSIVDLELRTIMCAPLQTHEETIGVIYVDSQFLHAVNKEDILRLFDILAGQAAIAIRNARLYEDLKKTYDELKDANEHIIRSERMALRGEMAAEVSHELKNILNVILLQAQMLQRSLKKSDTPATDKFLKDIIDSVRKIHNFSENLLVRSNISSEMKPVQLNTFVESFVAFIKVLPKFRKDRIVVKLEEDLPEVNIDVDQIQQVLLNLANNAVEAYGEATITFETKYDFIRNAAHLIVADNGPGLDPRVKEKLFVENITTKPDGHGFGLPVCRKIVRNHNGDIIAQSQPGCGTKFIITLPVPA